MVLNFQRIRLKKRKSLILFLFHFAWSLVLCVIIQACLTQKEHSGELEILWKEERAIGLLIPSVYIKNVPADSITTLLRVSLSATQTRSAILGDFDQSDNGIVFRPLISFTPGLTYEVSVANEIVGKVQIPYPHNTKVPELVELYPSRDTLPENLLKIYLTFSNPMREGQALKYISLLKNGVDTVDGAFLDLQPELWNKDYTMLTLWLDPGRIKRDLQPNQQLGMPLEKGNSYTLVVKPGWPDIRGVTIGGEVQKKFFVGERDSIRPDINSWVLKLPKQNTKDPLLISLNESLDGVLLNSSIQIIFDGGNRVNSEIEILNQETIVRIIPESPWRKGSYILEVEGILEDLAGNNLNRLFDRDITRDVDNPQQEVFKRRFEIQ